MPIRRPFRLPAPAFALSTALSLAIAAPALASDGAHHMHSAAASPSAVGGPGEAGFLAENDAAMAKMMQDMAAPPSGDVDRDFVAMMEPHHQGAIDMARALLRYGKNEQLKRLAQEIIVTQQQEIAAMRLAVGLPLVPAAGSAQAAAAPAHP
jgi:uncharacterized protein (DUF305 family)